MKFGILLIPVLALAFLAVPMSDADTEPEEITFTDGLFTFQIINDVRVAAIAYDNDHAEEVVEIPAEVEHDGISYIVTDLLCSFSSDNIIGVKIPEHVWNIPHPGLIKEGKNIDAFIVHDANFNLMSDNGILFDRNMSQLIAYPKAYQTAAYGIPSTVTTICESAFEGCNNLIYVDTYIEGLTEIRARAFYGCENLEYMTNIAGINTLPNTVTIIDNEAFKNCPKLCTFYLPDNIKIIGEGAFEGTPITTVNIPEKTVYIGEGAFGNCGQLETITSDNNSRYIVENDVLFEIGKDTRTLFTYPAGKKDAEYTIDDKVTSIADMAFAGTKYLKKVKLPDEMMMVPSGSFTDCTSLEEIDLSRIVLVDMLSFWNCTNLRTVTLGAGLTTINQSAFENCGFEEVVLPSSVTHIGMFAFADCKDLKKVTIPEYTAAEISLDAFQGCTSLKEIDLLSSDIVLREGSLNIADKEQQIVDIVKPKRYSIPSGAVTDDLTVLSIHDLGERPYPYENLIGVAICLLILYMIVRLFRKV